MATYQAIFPPANERSTQVTVNATTSTGDIIIGGSQSQTMFAITATGTISIRFGTAANIANADATDWPIPAGAVQEWALPAGCDRFRVFNPGASAVKVNYWGLTRS